MTRDTFKAKGKPPVDAEVREVLAEMLGAAEADGLDLNSNEWRNHMIAAREVLGLS